MSNRSTYWKATSSGTAFDFAAPTPDMIDAATIIHELTMINRWGGNIEFPFSVAQHSMLVADNISNPAWRIYGLLHDAVEAFTGDHVTPYKAYLQASGADVVGDERRILACVWKHFDLPHPTEPIARAVDAADHGAAATEHRDVVKGRHPDFRAKAKPFAQTIKPMAWPNVSEQFASRLMTYLQVAKEAA